MLNDQFKKRRKKQKPIETDVNQAQFNITFPRGMALPGITQLILITAKRSKQVIVSYL